MMASTPCNESLALCNASLADVTQNYTDLLAAYDGCGCGVDPCAADASGNYDLGLHIAAVFIILVASGLGVALPFMTRAIKAGIVPYLIVLGKCMGIGVILACALVHMLQPANASLTSPCVPAAFNSDYTAYAYLFAMLAALAMQAFDFVLLRAMNASNLRAGSKSSTRASDGGGSQASLYPKPPPQRTGHVHAVLPMELDVQKTVAAYMLEFGVTVHSVFIGLAVGTVGDTELTGLLVALCFHQFFEGLALGARLVDANLPSHWHEFLLGTLFSVSAPIGIGIGIGVATSLDPNGETFLLVQGSFDAVCAGILLYIGFALLFHDFPEDMDAHCEGNAHDGWRRFGMFVCLWVGAGLMAFIGRYL